MQPKERYSWKFKASMVIGVCALLIVIACHLIPPGTDNSTILSTIESIALAVFILNGFAWVFAAVVRDLRYPKGFKASMIGVATCLLVALSSFLYMYYFGPNRILWYVMLAAVIGGNIITAYWVIFKWMFGK